MITLVQLYIVIVVNIFDFDTKKLPTKLTLILSFLKHRTSVFTFPITQITNNVGGKVYLGYELNSPVFKISKAPKITEKCSVWTTFANFVF